MRHPVLQPDGPASQPTISSLELPIELYCSIVQFSTHSDLLSLAQVSHTFQELAEDVLYDHVDLQKSYSNRRMAMRWCLTISSNPRRAKCVRSLKFPSTFNSPYTEDFDVDVQETIAKAFNAIVNLKHLWLLGVGEKHGASLHPSTLKDCTFSLASLGGQTSSFSVDDMWDFLGKHPDLEYWAPTVPLLASVSGFPSHVAPNLRQAVIVDPTKISSLGGRPLESLCVVFISSSHTIGAGQDAISSLRLISSTLHTLSYTHGPLVGWSAIEMLSSLVRSAPNLKSLTFTTFGQSSDKILSSYRQTLATAISQFRRLETLVLATCIECLPHSNDGPMDAMSTHERLHDWSQASLNPVECREVASQIMRSTPSLVEVSLPFKSLGSRMLTYLRDTQTGEAVFDGFRVIDTSGWWMR